jgi:hypothetical protein
MDISESRWWELINHGSGTEMKIVGFVIIEVRFLVAVLASNSLRNKLP